MSDPVAICINGETLLLDALGAVFWPAQRTLIVSDLHLEKGAAFARRGVFLPPYDSFATLARLSELLLRHRPARVIALGDSFHDGEGPDGLPQAARERLARFQDQAEWIWIEGNHDPDIPAWLGGRRAAQVALGGLIFRHLPESGQALGEIAGHLHPCATVSRRGHALRRRCFLTDGRRLILPAFGAYAGGLDVRDAAFAPLFGSAWLAYALGARRVYAVAGDAQLARRKINEDSQPINAAISTVEIP